MKSNCSNCKHCGIRFDRESRGFKKYCQIDQLFDNRLNVNNDSSWDWKKFDCFWHNDHVSRVRIFFRNLLA